MDSGNFMLIILGGGFFVGTFISFLLIFDKNRARVENIYLGIVVFLCSLNLIHPHLNLIFGEAPGLGSIGLSEPSQFLIVPLVWLYIRKHLSGNYRFDLRESIHFLPFLIVLTYIILPVSSRFESFSPYPLSSILLWVLLVIQAIFYMYFSMKLIVKVRDDLSNHLSSFKGLDLKWIQSFFHLFVALYTGYFIILVLIVHFNAFQEVRIILSAAFMLLIWIIGFRALRKERTIPQTLSVKTMELLDSGQVKSLVKKLDSIMVKEKIYLNPELTLNDLTEELNSTRNEISWVLNNSIGKNFYNYVNEFRVLEVIGLMKDQKRDYQKILALAFDAGFNSKPAFNAVFKKNTGKTPSEYRKDLKKEV
jgi:AraC-like DNA-binding protein